MPLKRTSEYKRDDYAYESPDGERYEISIFQTSERRYVEIKRYLEDGEIDCVNWDLEMLLDIADAVRDATKRQTGAKPKSLMPKPKIVDRRDEVQRIQASVNESMEKMDTADISPVQSLEADVNARMGRTTQTSAEGRIKRV